MSSQSPGEADAKYISTAEHERAIAEKHKQYELVVRHDDRIAFIALLKAHMERFPEVFEQKVKEAVEAEQKPWKDDRAKELAAVNEAISRLRYDYEIALLVQLELIDENTRLREALFEERHEPR